METGQDGSALVARHVASKKKLRLLRTGGPLLLILVMAIMIWMIVRMFTGLDRDLVTANLEAEGKRVWPKVQTQLMTAAQALKPEVQRQFETQQAVLGPKVNKKFGTEMKAMKGKVNSTFGDALKNSLAAAEKDQKKILVEEFPQLAGNTKAQEKVLGAAQRGSSEWAKNEFNRSLNGHMSSMTKIRDTLNVKYGVEGAKKQHPEHVMMTWLELMADTVGGDDNILAEEKPDDGKKKKKQKKKKVEPAPAPAPAPSEEGGTK